MSIRFDPTDPTDPTLNFDPNAILCGDNEFFLATDSDPFSPNDPQFLSNFETPIQEPSNETKTTQEVGNLEIPTQGPFNETKRTQEVADAHLQQMPKRTMAEAELSERASLPKRRKLDDKRVNNLIMRKAPCQKTTQTKNLASRTSVNIVAQNSTSLPDKTSVARRNFGQQVVPVQQIIAASATQSAVGYGPFSGNFGLLLTSLQPVAVASSSQQNTVGYGLVRGNVGQEPTLDSISHNLQTPISVSNANPEAESTTETLKKIKEHRNYEDLPEPVQSFLNKKKSEDFQKRALDILETLAKIPAARATQDHMIPRMPRELTDSVIIFLLQLCPLNADYFASLFQFSTKAIRACLHSLPNVQLTKFGPWRFWSIIPNEYSRTYTEFFGEYSRYYGILQDNSRREK